MLYLVFAGVGLRSAPLIKPTPIAMDQRNVAADVMLRLYADLHAVHYVVWGVLPTSSENEQLFALMKEEHEKIFHVSPNVIRDATSVSPLDLAACEKPCWLLVGKENANELRSNSFIQSRVLPLGRPYLTISWIDFRGDEGVSPECNQEKRLSLQCLKPISVREVQRKLKDPGLRYFFLRKYEDRDHFLFLQQR